VEDQPQFSGRLIAEATLAPGGTGLGLLLVNAAPNLHGGRVKVESKVGEGTTVMVTLPVFQRNHKKILIIEDEPEMRRNITTLLRYYDYEPVAAANGVRGRGGAWDRARLILCDVMMPELDGTGCCRLCKRGRTGTDSLHLSGPLKARRTICAAAWTWERTIYLTKTRSRTPNWSGRSKHACAAPNADHSRIQT